MFVLKQTDVGAGPMAEWLSSCFHFGGPGFHGFASWAQTWYCSSGHAEVASHIPQLEGPTTKIYSYVLGGFGEKNRKKITSFYYYLSQLGGYFSGFLLQCQPDNGWS